MYQKTIYNKKSKIRTLLKSIRLNEIIMLITGFFLGGATLFEEISIFGVACAVSYLKKGFRSFCVILPVLGYVLKGDIFKLKYVAACIFLCLLRELLHKVDKLEKFSLYSVVVYPLCASWVFLAQGGSIYECFIIVIECIIFHYFVKFYDTFLNYFSSKGLRRTVKQSELGAIVFVCALCMTWGSDVELPLGINPSGVISVFIIMFCALEFPL